jgi:hypothetical protein
MEKIKLYSQKNAIFAKNKNTNYMNRIIVKISIFAILVWVGFGLLFCNRKAKDKDANSPVVLQLNENSGVYGGIFSIPEVEIVPSPDMACEYVFPKEEQIVDYSVSPMGSFVAVIVEQNKQHSLKLWEIGTSELLEGCIMPQNFKAEMVVWHPQASVLFVLGMQNKESVVYRIEKTKKEWNTKQIFSSAKNLKNMVICPQPFITDYDNKTRDVLVQKFYDSMEPGGYLFIGHSESLNHTNTPYKYIMPAVYRQI